MILILGSGYYLLTLLVRQKQTLESALLAAWH